MDNSQPNPPAIALPLADTIDTFTAARIAGVSENTIRRWCDEGRIRACKLVGPWKIFKAEFYKWIDSKQPQTSFSFDSSDNPAQNSRTTQNT